MEEAYLWRTKMLTTVATMQVASRIKNELADKEDLLRRQLLMMSGALEPNSAADELDRAQWSTIAWNQEAIAGKLRFQVDCLRRALKGIGVGAYGLCEDCGETIPTERMEACPAATRCLSCEVRLTKSSERREGRWKRS